MPVALYAGNPQVGALGRPQPQTADYASAGPFIRHARPAARTGYTWSNATPANASQSTLPLTSAPGYLRRLDLTWQLSAGTTTTAAAQPDGPYNVASFVSFKDPWGTPVFSGPGYELFALVPKFSGQLWLLGQADVSSLPSWSAVAASTGAFTFRTALPLEITKGYGCMSIGNGSVMPTLAINTNPLATVLSGTLTTPGTLTLTVDESYYDVDPAGPVEPPGLGTSVQWAVVQGQSAITSGATQKISLPRLGGYLTTLIGEIRNASNAREDTWLTAAGRLKVYIDGVPYLDESYLEMIDHMAGVFGGTSRPAGVWAYTFKDSMSQLSLGLLDTLETVLLTNPGTLIELEGTPWGTGSGPATLYAIAGQLVPTGPLEQGLVEA